jgi:regulator of replication initiation timing
MALDNEFVLSELIKSGSSALKQEVTEDGTIVVDTTRDTDGETFGYVERPIYNETQLVKAVDTVVDELIGRRQKDAPAVVLKTVYDDLRAELEQALRDIKDLQEEVDLLTTENETLKIQIDQLNVDLDLANLLKSSAENERDSTNQTLQSVTLDLQAALSKGTKEAIERVSREASLQGLLAEKDAFIKLQEQAKEALDRANETISTLQDNLVDAQNNFATAANNLNGSAQNAQSGKIICTELYNQGFMPSFIYEVDAKFGDIMLEQNPHVMYGYWIWAQPIVNKLKTSKSFSKFVYKYFVKDWSEYMAYEMGVLLKQNYKGKFLHKFGEKFSILVYKLFPNKLKQVSWQ